MADPTIPPTSPLDQRILAVKRAACEHAPPEEALVALIAVLVAMLRAGGLSDEDVIALATKSVRMHLAPKPALTPDEATLLRWLYGETGASQRPASVPFRDDVRRFNDATRGLHKKGMVETFRWALTAAGVEALRALEKADG